ncbi:MAG: malto-oligosyltrehalose trehalohydrolase [Flavisolibacter sp.]
MKGIDVMNRSIGVNFNEKKEAEIIVWSPEAKSVEISFDNKKLSLKKTDEGYWEVLSTDIRPGTLYKFVIDGRNEFPDPASLSQPDGVHGCSEAIDLKEFTWTDETFEPVPQEDYILYELHTGTFTNEGSFEGIETKLDHLKELGVNAIEIMPVAQFPGDRNWGYDGVFPYAVQNSYGGANGLRKLVTACHAKGIAVVLDVVYNHLGPEGNYLGAYGPYFTEKYKTPWGPAVNFDDAWCDGVRRFFIENALMWFRDFHIDALRLDAVHAIKDFSAVHILREIKQHVDELMHKTGRKHYLVVELDLNDNRFINSADREGYGMDAQWIDEFHHALRVSAGGDNTGYYADFNGINHLSKAYRDAYVYDGQWSEHRKKKFGIKASNPGKQFIVFSQNHDQVGNRMLGERTSQLASFEMQKLLAAAVMISPYLPMLFMGEEWAEPHPFLYFVSHTDPELAEAVRNGRKAEFAAFHAEGEAPDPVDEKTFQQSKLQWQLMRDGLHKTMFNYYKGMIALRKTHPALRELNRQNISTETDSYKNILIVERWTKDQKLFCILNFSRKQQFHTPSSHINNYEKLFDSASTEWFGPKDASEKISAGQPGSPVLTIQAESILIYANKKIK